MGKIRGTLRTRRHIFVLLPTTKSLDKSFVFKNDDAKEGLKNMTRLAWAQEVPGSNPGAPTNPFKNLRASLKSPSAHYGENSGDPIGSSPASSPLLAYIIRKTSSENGAWAKEESREEPLKTFLTS